MSHSIREKFGCSLSLSFDVTTEDFVCCFCQGDNQQLRQKTQLYSLTRTVTQWESHHWWDYQLIINLTAPHTERWILWVVNNVNSLVRKWKKLLLWTLTCPSRSKARQAIPCVCMSFSMDTVCTVYESHTQIYGSFPTCPVATRTRSGCRAKLWKEKDNEVRLFKGWLTDYICRAKQILHK